MNTNPLEAENKQDMIATQIAIINALNEMNKYIEYGRKCVSDLDRAISANKDNCDKEIEELIDMIERIREKSFVLISSNITCNDLNEIAYHQLGFVRSFIKMTHEIAKKINGELEKILQRDKKPMVDWFDCKTRRDFMIMEKM